MKKSFVLMSLSALSLTLTLVADPYYGYSSCPGGNCPYQQNSYPSRDYQGQPPRDYYQGQPQRDYYQGQPPRDYYQGQQPRNYYQGQPSRDQRYESYQGQYQGNQGYGNDRRDDYNKGDEMGGGYGRNNSPQNPQDEEIAKKLHDALSAGWTSKGYPNVSYEIENGNVILRGTVNSNDDREKIEKNVKNLEGVRQVNNQIRVSGEQTAYNDTSTDRKLTKEEQKYPQDQAVTESDKLINVKIREKLSGWFTHEFDNLIIRTNNGVVTVTGTVEKADDIQKINKKLKDIDGVKSVNNQVTSKNM